MMQSREESLFDGIDGAIILKLLPEKIKQSEERVASTALDLAALYLNEHATKDEVDFTERAYAAQRFQWLDLKSRLARIEAATKSSGTKSKDKEAEPAEPPASES